MAQDPDQAPPDPASPLSRLAIPRSGPAARGRRRPWFRRPVVLAGIVAAAALALLAAQRARAPLEVEAATVARAFPSQALALLNATGRVTARTRASVASKATGRLEWLGVVEGQRVNAGEVIARLESRDVAAQREQAAAALQAAQANRGQGRAELTLAEADLGRARDLAQRRFVSDATVEEAHARVIKARAAVEALHAQVAVAQASLRASEVAVEQTLIRAPFTGVVLTRSANVGDIVTPFSSAAGTTGAVVTMADMATLEVEADVAENAIAKVEVGQPAEILLDAYPELRMPGRVSRIVPTVDRSKATLLVKLAFATIDPRVLPDMSARVAFLARPLAPAELLPVPAVRPEAVVRRSVDGAEREVVFLIETGATGTAAAEPAAGAPAASAAGADTVPARVRRLPVAPAGKVGDLLRVDALQPGARVVLSPPAELADGAAVTIIVR